MSHVEAREMDNEEVKKANEIQGRVADSAAKGNPLSILELTPEFAFLANKSYCLWWPSEHAQTSLKTLFFFDHILAPFPRNGDHDAVASTYHMNWDALTHAVETKKLLLFLEYRPSVYSSTLKELFKSCELAGYNPPTISLRFNLCIGNQYLDWVRDAQSEKRETDATTPLRDPSIDEILQDVMSSLGGIAGDELIRKLTGTHLSEREKTGFALDLTMSILCLNHAGFSEVVESLNKRAKGDQEARFGMTVVHDRYLLRPLREALFGFSLWNYDVDLKQIMHLDEYSSCGYGFSDSYFFDKNALRVPWFLGRTSLDEFQRLTSFYDSHEEIVKDLKGSVLDFESAIEAGRPDLVASAASKISEAFNERLSPRIVEEFQVKNIAGSLIGFGAGMSEKWPFDADSIRGYRECNLWPFTMASFALELDDYADAIDLVAEATQGPGLTSTQSKKWPLSQWWPFKERAPPFLSWMPNLKDVRPQRQ
jgi:hypothetical protein